MNGDDLTSQKNVSRVSLSPKLKEATSILCVESLLNSSFHQRLLTDHAKSPTRELRNRRGREEKKVPLNKGAIYLVESDAGRGLFSGSTGPFSKYLRLDKPWTVCGSIESVKRQTRLREINREIHPNVIMAGRYYYCMFSRGAM